MCSSWRSSTKLRFLLVSPKFRKKINTRQLLWFLLKQLDRCGSYLYFSAIAVSVSLVIFWLARVALSCFFLGNHVIVWRKGNPRIPLKEALAEATFIFDSAQRTWKLLEFGARPSIEKYGFVRSFRYWIRQRKTRRALQVYKLSLCVTRSCSIFMRTQVSDYIKVARWNPALYKAEV